MHYCNWQLWVCSYFSRFVSATHSVVVFLQPSLSQHWMRMRRWKLMYDQMLLTWTLNSRLVLSISLINVFKFPSVTQWYLSIPSPIPPSSFSTLPSLFLHHFLPLSIHLFFVLILMWGYVMEGFLTVPSSHHVSYTMWKLIITGQKTKIKTCLPMCSLVHWLHFCRSLLNIIKYIIW